MLKTTMEYQGFRAEIGVDASADMLHGRVLGIEDMVDFYGKDLVEVCHEFHVSIDCYLEWFRNESEEPKLS